MKKTSQFLGVTFFLLLSATAFSAIIYVNGTASGGNSGESWANAYTSLQSALDDAESGDNIWIAKGTYKPSYDYGLGGGSRYYHFRMVEGVVIYGGFAGAETDIDQRSNYGVGEANETILSGDIGTEGNDNDNCYHVFYHPDIGLSNVAGLDGLTITKGNANGSDPYDRGGGMYNYSCSPQLTDVAITYNSASSHGGGLYNHASSSILSNVAITNNTATNYGGGVYNCNSSSPTLNYVTINNNSAANGGGICNLNSSSPTLRYVMISSNIASNEGGGIWNYNSSSPQLTNVTITNNLATYGGGISNGYYSDPRLTNVTLSGNNAGTYGGGIYNFGNYSDLTILNCIIWSNTASTNGNEFYFESGTAFLDYCCYSNSTGDVYLVMGTFHLENGNITSDPCFVGSSNNPTHPYSIGGISPCADAGNNGYNDELFDVRGSGYPRKLNKISGESGTIDMGAYEYKAGTDSSLPVELTDFSASYSKNQVILQWTTQSETDNLGFILEKRLQVSGDWLQVADYRSDESLQGCGSSSERHDYQFTDKAVVSGAIYLYRLADVDYSGKVTWHDPVEITIPSEDAAVPVEFGLQKVFPNPFNPAVTLRYGLAKDAETSLTVYNMRGQLVEVLENTYKPKGAYDFVWQPQNLSAGVYIVRLQSGNQTNLQKIVFVK